MLNYRFIGLLAQAGADLSVYRFIGLSAQAGADLSVYRFIGLSAQAGKNRPCHHAEIINLIDENKTITGNLPDRTATFYKASPEGSFFDGTDALELLKEQQSRILQRQMQDLLLRQNVRANGGTFHLERHRQSSSSSSSSDTSSSTPVSLGEDRGRLSVGLQADLQRRQQQLRDREQQTGQAHGQELTRQLQLPTLDSFLQNVSSPLRRMIQPLPIPARQPETVDLTG